jgi:hypothetical protein
MLHTLTPALSLREREDIFIHPVIPADAGTQTF